MSMKRGIYETDYGNSAYVSGPRAELGTDMDNEIRDHHYVEFSEWDQPYGASDGYWFRKCVYARKVDLIEGSMQVVTAAGQARWFGPVKDVRIVPCNRQV